MKMQQERRTSPYPWTWEIPVTISVAVLLVMTLAVQVARAVANVVAGAGWQLTPRPALFSSLPGLLTGDATAGLPAAPTTHANSGELWFWIVATELILLVAIVLILRSGLHLWGPGRVRGMASPGEADQLLGLARLRRNAAMIRPDLYGKRKAP